MKTNGSTWEKSSCSGVEGYVFQEFIFQLLISHSFFSHY